ncbi:MAG: porin, partial [Proteobacteria bacterium]|nr:porin [Pseudomonadota bacterium]
MNKSMIALAVGGGLAGSAAAQAETTLYGSARIGVTYTQPDGPGTDKSNWDVANEASRLGVKGSEDLGGGLKAIYQYEFGVAIAGNGGPLTTRLSSVGLTGGFGTVVLGRVWSAPYLYVGSLTDVFNSSSSGNSGSMGWDRLNSTITFDNTGALGTGDRISDVVAYITPNFSGFSGAAAIVMNGNGQNAVGNREDIDAYDIAGGYTLGGLTIGASYRDFKALDYTQWTAGAAYKFPFGLRLAATYSARDND